MSSKLLIALLAVIVVAAGAGAYIAFGSGHSDDGNGDDDSGPGGDDPSDPGTDDPSQPGTDDPGTDTPGEPTGGDRTFAFGEPQVGDWISGIMTEKYEGVTTEATIMFKVTAIEGDTMSVEYSVTMDGITVESQVWELPTSTFVYLPTVLIAVGDGTEPEHMELGTELIDTSRGEVLCDHYTLDDDRMDIDYWNFHGTEFMAKIVISDPTGQSTDQGIVIFDSNRLVETS